MSNIFVNILNTYCIWLEYFIIYYICYVGLHYGLDDAYAEGALDTFKIF